MSAPLSRVEVTGNIIVHHPERRPIRKQWLTQNADCLTPCATGNRSIHTTRNPVLHDVPSQDPI